MKCNSCGYTMLSKKEKCPDCGYLLKEIEQKKIEAYLKCIDYMWFKLYGFDISMELRNYGYYGSEELEDG